jgi:hypothetical protein
MSYLYDTIYAEDESDSESYLIGSDDDAENYSESRRRSRGRGRPSPVRPAPGGNLFRPRPTPGAASGGVTQAQLEAALNRVREQVTANANAIKTVDGRVRTIISDAQKLQAETRKDVTRLRSELKTTQTISALVPLIAQGNPKLAPIAPLAQLLVPTMLAGKSDGASSSPGGLLGGNNILAIGALAYASGIFDAKPA